MALFGKFQMNAIHVSSNHLTRTNKKQVMTWSVVVRNDIEQVRLYCPDCWSKAKAVVQAL